MTVSSTTNRKTFAGNDVTTSFATTPVVFFDTPDLMIFVVVDATGVSTTLTENTHYTVTGGAGLVGTVDLAGGSAPYGAPASGTTLVIVRDLAITQGVDFVNNDGSDAEVNEDALDRLTMIAQQLDARDERAIRLPDSDVSGSDNEVPAAGARASSVLGFDSLGKLATYALQVGTSLIDLAASTGAGLVGAIQSGTGAVLTTVQEWLRREKSVFDYMTAAQRADVIAKTYSLDVTTALQTAITQNLTSAGGHLKWPDGGYKLTAALTIPFSTGWKMAGASRAGVVLKQYTANTPIFKFTGDLTHSWKISGFSFDYNTPQVVGNTLAIPIHFIGTGASDTFFNFEIYDCALNNCYYGISGNSANTVTVGGGKFDRLSFGGGITGGAIRLTQTGSSGQPNNKFGSVYIDATAMTLNILDLNACDNTEFGNIEYNTVSNGPQLLNFTGGGSLTIGQIKAEGGTYTTNNRVIFNSTDSDVTIGSLKFTNSTINPGGGNQVYLIGSTGGGANGIKIDRLQVSASDVTVSSGKLYVAQAISTRKINIDRIVAALPTDCYLTNIASTTGADGVKVNEWNEPRLSADRGDAAVTLVAGTDASIQWFDTPLSVPRAVTLPTAAAENNLFNGLGYRFIRTASATGASGLDVGGLKTLAVGQWCDIVYHRSAWVLAAFGSL